MHIPLIMENNYLTKGEFKKERVGSASSSYDGSL